MQSTKKTIILREMLTDELKIITEGKPFIELDELNKILTETAIELFAIEKMGDPYSPPAVTPLEGYRLGNVKGLPSLQAICQEFFSGVSQSLNSAYIKEIHYAARPFFPSILATRDYEDVDQLASELLEALDFAKKHFLDEITAKIES